MTSTRKILERDEDFVDYCTRAGISKKLAATGASDIRVTDISGNINRVRRLEYLDGSGTRIASCVVKHVPAEGALERYRNILFPEDRLDFEAFYYGTIGAVGNRPDSLVRWAPSVLHHDAFAKVLVLADLAPDRSLEATLLDGKAPDANFFSRLGRDLALFHTRSATLLIPAQFRCNPSASLNRPFVLTLPLKQPEQMRSIWEAKGCAGARVGLQSSFLARHGEQLLPIARDLAQRFKSAECCVLTHGDLHGESLFVRADGAATAIDAELCDLGAAWFDPGMLLAHLEMLSVSLGMRLPSREFLGAYTGSLIQRGRTPLTLDILRMAGLEMIRRVIGAANARFLDTDSKRQTALDRAVALVLAPGSCDLFQEAS